MCIGMSTFSIPTPIVISEGLKTLETLTGHVESSYILWMVENEHESGKERQP